MAKNGAPYARLVPFMPPPECRPGLLEGRVDDAFFEPMPAEEPEARDA